MLYEALDVLRSEVNDYLKALPELNVSGNSVVSMSNVAREDGTVEIPNNNLGLTLVNIEEERIIRDVLSYQPQGKGTALNCALEYLGKVQQKRAVVFMISDFYDKDYDKRLSPLAMKHDMTALLLTDRRERELPRAGLLSLLERESGRRRIVDSRSEKVRVRWAAAARERIELLTRSLAKRGIPLVNLDSSGDWIKELSLYFLKKQAAGL